MEKNRTNPGLHRWFVPETRPEFDLDSAHIMIGEIFAIFFMQHWGLVVVNIALLLICFCTTGCALIKLKKEINRSLESTVIVGRIYRNSGDILLIYHLWAWSFGFERSIDQPFQPFNEGIIAYGPAGPLMLPEKSHFRFLSVYGKIFSRVILS